MLKPERRPQLIASLASLPLLALAALADYLVLAYTNGTIALADLFHVGIDVVSPLVLAVGAFVDRPWFDRFCVGVIGVVMLFTAGLIAWHAWERQGTTVQFAWALIILGLVNAYLARERMRIITRVKRAVMQREGHHANTDVIGGLLIVATGILILLGLLRADFYLSCGVAALIAVSGGRQLFDALRPAPLDAARTCC